jgi:hypothetical protein
MVFLRAWGYLVPQPERAASAIPPLGRHLWSPVLTNPGRLICDLQDIVRNVQARGTSPTYSPSWRNFYARSGPPDYESGRLEFESLRARQYNQ